MAKKATAQGKAGQSQSKGKCTGGKAAGPSASMPMGSGRGVVPQDKKKLSSY